jgi:hypothetical protein
MKKLIIYLFMFFFSHQLLFSQDIISSIKFDPIFQTDRNLQSLVQIKMMKKIDDSSFLFFRTLKIDKHRRNCIQRYNRKLEELYRIVLPESGCHEFFEYLPSTGSILYIEQERAKKKYTIYGVLYNVGNGNEISKTILSDNRADLINPMFSENLDYVGLSPQNDWDKNATFSIFNARNLKRECEVNALLPNNETYLFKGISNLGNLILISTDMHGEKIDISIYSINGKLDKKIKIDLNSKNKHHVNHLIFKESADGTAILAYLIETYELRNSEDHAEQLNLYTLDYKNPGVKHMSSVNFDKTFIKDNLYLNYYNSISNEDAKAGLIRKRDSGPSELRELIPRNIYILENHNVIVLLEKLMSDGGVYSSGPIIALSLDSLGKLKWNCVLQRESVGQKIDMTELLYIRKWECLKAAAAIKNGQLELIYLDMPGHFHQDFNITLRRIDCETGKMNMAKALIAKFLPVINVNYLESLDDNTFVLLNLMGLLKTFDKHDFRCQVVSLVP